MTEPTSPRSGKRASWLRKLLYVFGGLLVLLVVAYFVVSSSAFFKGVILPRAGKSLGGQVTVAEASISPFSQVYLQQLKVQTTGPEPLLQAEEVRLRYSLISILGGTMKVNEVTIVSPVVQIIENADGTSNLDPLLKPEKPEKEKPAPKPSTPSGKPPQIDLKNFTLKNATIRHIKILKDGGREVAELSGIDITLDQLKNGQPGKLTVAAAFKLTRPTNDVLEARNAGHLEFTLGADLLPTTLQLKAEQEILRAEGSLRELAGHRTTLTGDVTPTEVKEFSERFFQGNQLLGELKLSGPLDLSKKEGHLKLEVASIDRQVLNLVGAPLGIDFGTTVLNSTTEISLTQGGSVIAADTRFNAAKFSLTQNGQTTPPLDLQVNCTVTVNTADQSARLQTLTLNGTQNQKPLLRGSLTQPMTLAWGNSAAAAGDATFDLAVTDFNFADWKAVLGDSVSAGRLSLNLNVLSQQGGKQLKLGLTSQIADLALQPGATPLTIGAKLDGTFANQALDLRQLQLTLTPTARAPKNELNVAGQLDLSTPTTKGRLNVKADTFDVTQLYDAFAGEKNSATSTPTAGASARPAPAASSPGNVEPDPKNLPLQLTADAKLDRVYLHEIAITNWQATAKVDGGRITIDPCRLALNGAPVNATVDLNLGVKGYVYALSLLMDGVPLEPIANTFSPANRGQYQGLILANAQIKGAGVTGKSLQKNLTGQASFTFTNANIQLMGPKTKKVIVPIATLLRVNEITQSPVNWLDAQTEIGGGNIKVSRFTLQSAAFEARTQGVIPIAEVLTNSPLNLPVDFALRRSLAEKSSLLAPNTPTNAAYAPLPNFVTLKGTLGEPKSELHELALGSMLLQSGTGLAEKYGVKVDPKTSNLLRGIIGQRTATTNQPSTNPAPKLNPLDFFKKQ
jgi:hypothetical protein